MNAIKSIKKQERSANFEILRNLAMLFIVIYHILYHGVHLKETVIAPDTVGITNFILSQYLLTICSTCVNLYVLITGYFLFEKSFKSIRFIKVWFMALFYGLIMTSIVHYIDPSKASLSDVVNNIRPWALGPYWFVQQYLGLLIISPFLGYIARTITQKQYKWLIIAIVLLGTNFTLYIGTFPFGGRLIFNRGFSLIWFICLFFVGAYIKRFGFRYKSFRLFFTISILVCFYEVIRIFLLHYFFGKNIRLMNYDYNGFPFVLAVLFFCWIKNINFKDNFIIRFLVRIAPYTFAVYLIHDNRFFRSTLYSLGGVSADLVDSWWMIPHILIFSIVVFLVCIGIDFIRDRIFTLCRVNKVENIIASKIDSWIDVISSKLD